MHAENRITRPKVTYMSNPQQWWILTTSNCQVQIEQIATAVLREAPFVAGGGGGRLFWQKQLTSKEFEHLTTDGYNVQTLTLMLTLAHTHMTIIDPESAYLRSECALKIFTIAHAPSLILRYWWFLAYDVQKQHKIDHKLLTSGGETSQHQVRKLNVLKPHGILTLSHGTQLVKNNSM